MKTTGIIDGDMALNAAIYKKQVCDVCLNCVHEKCINTIDGCEAFRAAVKAHTRKYNRGDGKRAAKGRRQDKAGVG